MTSRTARGSAAATLRVVPESAGVTSSTHLRHDLTRRARDYERARRRAETVRAAAAQALQTDDLARAELLANRVAAAYRQLATAAWELARARAELG